MDIKIIDCSIFFNEINLLLYRLKTYYEYIDKFIIVEAKQTFTGKNKISNFKQNEVVFMPYMEKIIYVNIELPNLFLNNNNLSLKQVDENERYQRNYIKHEINKLTKLKDSDIIILSDIDEFIDIERLKEIKSGKLIIENTIYDLEQDMYYYNLNTKTPDKWLKAKVFNFCVYYNFILQNNVELNSIRIYSIKINDIVINRRINKGGWHLSYFYSPEFIKIKIANFAHQELNVEEFTNLEKIQQRITDCKDLFDRNNVKWFYIKIEANDYLPPNYEEIIRM